jgi:hypothetical protein
MGGMKEKRISVAAWCLVAILFFVFGACSLAYSEPISGICFMAVGGANLALAIYQLWKPA